MTTTTITHRLSRRSANNGRKTHRNRGVVVGGLILVFLLILPWQPSLSLNQHDLTTMTEQAKATTKSNQDKGNPILFPPFSHSMPPIRVLRQYIQQHGRAALLAEVRDYNKQHEPQNQNSTTTIQQQKHGNTSSLSSSLSSPSYPFDPDRRFTLAFYSCPHRAGNILHSFFNQLLWAILTNRTVLVQWDGDSGENRAYRVECQERIVALQSWLTQYEEWRDVLPPPVPLQPRLKQKDTATTTTFRHQWQSLTQPRVLIFPPIGAIQGRHFQTELERVSWTQDPVRLSRLVGSWYYHGNRRAVWWQIQWRAPTRQLYRYGREFVYGMLFRACFRVLVGDALTTRASTPQQYQMEQQQDSTTTTPHISLAVHSRHPKGSDDGADVTDEKHCLQQLITAQQPRRRQQNRNSKTSCIVYIMSDRTATLYKLTQWLRTEHGCEAKSASLVLDNNNKNQNQTTTAAAATQPASHEHGPFRGGGFWNDLEYCAQARTGLVADLGRSSSALLQELMEYDTTLWRRRHGGRKLPVCHLPKRLP